MRAFTKLMASAACAVMAASGAVCAADWSGPYAGVTYGQSTNDTVPQFFGLNGGYNFDNGNIVYGGELQVMFYSSGLSNLYNVTGRIGFEPSANLLLFANAGAGMISFNNATYGIVGLGAEYMITDKISLRGDFDSYIPVSMPDNPAYVAKLGVAYHF